MDVILEISRLLECFSPTACCQDVVVAISQQSRNKLQDLRIVVNHENRFLMILGSVYLFQLQPTLRSRQRVWRAGSLKKDRAQSGRTI